MKVTLNVKIDEATQEVDFTVNKLICAGWSGRDPVDVQKHADELRHLGIDPPEKFPIIFPVSRYLLTTGEEVEVIGSETSGEVEYVIFYNNREECYITIGSDHTDRALESISIEKSKQSCPKIISPEAWRYQDIKDHWDSIVIKSIVEQGGKKILYQKESLRSLLKLETLLGHIDTERFGEKGLVIFSGTIPLTEGELVYSNKFRFVMSDPVLQREIAGEYKVTIL
jgi:hypothetical protein